MIHFFENSILFFATIAVVLNVLPHKTFYKYALWMAYVAVAFCLLDIIFGHFRWQMVLAYSISILMTLLPRLRKSGYKTSHWSRKLLFSGYVFATLLITFVALLIPKTLVMFELPVPTGTYKVGIQDIHLIDKNRSELATNSPNDYRELMLRVWYPATIQEDDVPEPFVREIEPAHQIFNRWVPLPVFTLSHLKKIASHSYLNASIVKSNNKFPLLIFNHGNSFYAAQNTLLMEELASHGYLVISIDHTYHASWVQFPDERIVYYQSEGSIEFSEEDISKYEEKAKNDARAFLYGPYDDYYKAMKSGIEGSVDMNDRVEVWIDDIEFVLNELERNNNLLTQLSNAYDPNRIGVFGMSLGGAAAGKFCLEDKRCKAILNMDGTQFGHNAMQYEFQKPFLMMNSDVRYQNAAFIGETIDENTFQAFEMNDFLLRQSKNICYNMVIEGSSHGSFSDFLIMTADLGNWTGLLGSINPWTMKDILNEYTLAFFNKHLRGTNEELLELETQKRSEIIKFEVYNSQGEEKSLRSCIENTLLLNYSKIN